jgi:hypothetical protein
VPPGLPPGSTPFILLQPLGNAAGFGMPTFLFDTGETFSVTNQNREDQIFSVEIDGDVVNFDVAKLEQMAAAAPDHFGTVRVPVTARQAREMIATRGIETSRLKSLTAADLANPGMACLLEDGDLVTVDGHHRYVRRWRKGLRWMVFRVAPPEVWRLCLIGLPEAVGRDLAYGRLAGQRR